MEVMFSEQSISHAQYQATNGRETLGASIMQVGELDRLLSFLRTKPGRMELHDDGDNLWLSLYNHADSETHRYTFHAEVVDASGASELRARLRDFVGVSPA